MSYVDVVALREYLGQVANTAERDVELQAILDRAHAIVNEALGFSFSDWGSASTKDIYVETTRTSLEIPAHQIGTVASIYYVHSRGTSDETTEELTEWMEEEDGRLYRYSGWSPGWYRIEAVWGYGPAPDSIIEVELEVAVNIWRSRDAAGFSDVLGPEGQTITVHRALTWSQRSIIDAVRMAYLGVVHA